MRGISPGRLFFLKIFALLSIVRWQAILLVGIAQVLVSMFVINNRSNWYQTITDYRLWLILLSTLLTVAAGFAINSFYDQEKDMVNRPKQTNFERFVSKQFLFRFYFTANALAMVTSLAISWRALLFFTIYAAGLWLYSHKLKRATFIGNISAVALSIAPFFAIFVYYRYMSWPILFYVSFLLLLILIREFIKDLQALKGDLIYGYETLPAVYGEEKTKSLILMLTVFSYLPAFVSYPLFEETLQIFLIICMAAITLSNVLLFRAKNRFHYYVLNQVYKIFIGAGIIMSVFL